MNQIPKSFIQDIIARTDIVPIIESRVALKKRGNNFISTCPFHSEKTPSFTVSHTKQFYYCFGCGAHGNVIGFLMEYDRLSFVEAVTQLAEQSGLTVPTETNTSIVNNHNELCALLMAAQKIYQQQLAKTPAAIQYLQSRGLTGEIARDFAIGYAPNAWEFLSSTLVKNNEQRKQLATAGMLIEKSPGRYYDRFRHRVLFPIRDMRGKTIAFGGRMITEDNPPKYLNSPETPVFHKQKTLYGLYEACQHHRQLKQALVVEGYLDVISLAQHGIHYAVATLGTAINIQHIQLLSRYTTNIIFCFDGDQAGKNAAWKAVTICLPVLRDGLNIRFLFLPTNEDPDSWIRKIKYEKFEAQIQQATPLTDVFFQHLQNEFPDNSVASKAAFAKKANEYLQVMPQGIFKDLLYTQLSSTLNIPRDQLTALLNITPIEKSSYSFEKTSMTPSTFPKLSKRLTPLQTMIQLLLQQPALSSRINAMPNWEISEKTAEIQLFLQLMIYCSNQPAITLGELFELFESSDEKKYLATIAAVPIHITQEGMHAEFTGALQRIQEQYHDQQLSRLIQKAKHIELTAEEKQTVQSLLASKAAPLS